MTTQPGSDLGGAAPVAGVTGGAERVDAVNHPPHYNAHPVCEAIDICEELPFNLGNAVKYLWRAKQKGNRTEDLRKALWYLERQRQLEKGEQGPEELGQEPCLYCPRELRKLVAVVATSAATEAALGLLLTGMLNRVTYQEAVATLRVFAGAP